MNTKNLFWAALSMTAALMMTACSSDDNDMTEAPVAPSTSKTIPYTVTVGGDDATTRATVKDDPEDRQLYFATGDQLYITGTDIQGVLNITSGVGESTGATFSGELTYSGSGSPADDLSLTATLVSAQQTVGTQVSVDGAGAVTVNYPTTAYCSTISDAVQKYSKLTGTSTYGEKAFTLTQQTAFLNFEITVTGGTSGTKLPANVINSGASIAKANVTTVNNNGVKAKFVLPVAIGSTLSSATVKLGGKEIGTAIGNTTLSTGKVYNVKRTVDMSTLTLADVFNDDAVVFVKVNTANSQWYGVTGTYNAGSSSYTTTSSGSYGAPHKGVSMTKDGNNLVARLNAYNDMTITFNTTNNKYTLSATSASSDWRMTTLNSITINGVNITSQLTDATPVAVRWNFSEIHDSANLNTGYENGGVTLQGDGMLDFGYGQLMGELTFTNSLGKNFKSIVITVSGSNVNLSGFSYNWSSSTYTWSGNSDKVSFSGDAMGISSIVFTLE